MAEVTTAGYQDVRDYLEANWVYIELRDDADNPVMRLDTTDERVEWTHESEDQVLVLKVTLQGDDEDVTLPQKFEGSVIYKQAEGGDALTPVESFTIFEMAAEEDQLTVKHKLEVPQVV